MLMAATVINEHLAETVLPFSSLQTMTFILSEVTHTNHICTCSPFFHLLMQKNVCNRNIIPVKMQTRVVLRQAWLKRPGVFLSSENESILGKTVVGL